MVQGHMSKERAFITANHIHSIINGMHLKSADLWWIAIISIMCQNESIKTTLKPVCYTLDKLLWKATMNCSGLLHGSCMHAYLVSPRAWAWLHQCGFPQWPSATRPCGGRWHASSVPTSRRRSSHRASGSRPAPSCQTDPQSNFCHTEVKRNLLTFWKGINVVQSPCMQGLEKELYCQIFSNRHWVDISEHVYFGGV